MATSLSERPVPDIMPQGCRPPKGRPTGCGPRRPDTPQTLALLVAHYLQRSRRDEMLNYCARSPNLRIAKARAARCLLSDGRRHSHQRRIPIESLEAIERRLAAADLTDCTDFDGLYDVIADAARSVRMIWPLTTYDIAHRIGRFLKVEPTRVYLHAGTREGARALGLGCGRNVLEMSPHRCAGRGPALHLQAAAGGTEVAK